MKYRKKPEEIEALKYVGDNYKEVKAFAGDFLTLHPIHNTPVLHSNEIGDSMVFEGDFVVKGFLGTFFICKPDKFKETYEPVFDKR